MAIIETRGVSYFYSKGTPFEKKAIDNINLTINNNEFVGIIGTTGSGKSTLIEHFNGLLKPHIGQVIIDGKDIWNKPDDIYQLRFKVGLVFQAPEHQLFEETVFKDISFGPKNMNLSEQEIIKRVAWAADIVGLSQDLLSRSPFEISGGEQRKAAIAGVISMDPDVLILDEPTAGLDPKSKNKLLENIVNYHRTRKNTVILISHNMDDVAELCERVIVLNDGKIFMDGKTKDVFYETELLKEVNILPPVITQIFLKLSNDGYVFNEKIHTIKDAISFLEKLKNR